MRKLTVKLILSTSLSLLAASQTFAAPLSPNKQDLSIQKKNTQQIAPNFYLKTLPSQFRLTFDNVQMPTSGERRMGLLGVNYFVNLNDWFYGGVGGYGAISGERGGLFVLGFEGGVDHRIVGNLWGNAGFYVGGGGGHDADVGGGLMIRPHVGLAYDFGKFRVGADLSKVRFPKGNIDSNQVGVTLTIPTDILYGDPDYQGQSISSISSVSLVPSNSLTFDKFYLALIEQTYFQKSGQKGASGEVKDKPMSLVGVEAGRFFTPSVFGYLKFGGAFAGDNNGYMDVLGGLGYRYTLNERVAFTARLGAGAGGGGDVRVGGGALIEPSVGVQYRFTSHFMGEISGGYIKALDGNFGAGTLNFKIIYQILSAKPLTTSLSASDDDNSPETLAFRTWRIRLGNQTYFHAQRKSNAANDNVQLTHVAIDAMLNKHIYLTGQAASAYSGDAGAYSSGMIGLGYDTATYLKQLHIGAEVLGGAGGGGGIDISGGAIVQPAVNATYYFNKYFGVQGSVGRVISLKGKLSATTLNLDLIFRFSTLTG